MIKALKDADFEVETDSMVGTARVYFEGVEIFAALQKGRNQPWIVSHVHDLFESTADTH
jgi:hypothetical protein